MRILYDENFSEGFCSCRHIFFGTIFIFNDLYAAPQPSVSPSPDMEVLIGEPFLFQVEFDNTDATDTGYGPFIDVVVPATGVDGDDGIDSSSATYHGVAVTTTVMTFPDDGSGTGCVDHPLAVDNAGVPLRVCGKAGDKLITIECPFGSFVPDQPPAVLDLNLPLSNKADLGTPLTIYTRAGFRFGSTALDDYATDPSIVSDADTDPTTWARHTTITPALMTVEKTFSDEEAETATGPNFPRRYIIEVNIADGQVISDLDVTDMLPSNVVFLSVLSSSSSSGAGTVTSAPAAGEPVNPPDNNLVVHFASVTGGTPVRVEFEYFIPQFDADNATVIDASSGDDVLSDNNAKAVGDWTPIDNRDTGGTDNAVADPPGVEHSLTDKAIAIQKSSSVVSGNGINPGSVLEYTITFQVSDYFSFKDVVVNDIFSDG